MSEADETPKGTDIAGRLDGLVGRTYGTARMTDVEYNAISPKMKGYAHYMFGAWPEAGEHLKVCPFSEGTAEYDEFQQGQFAAMLEAQDSED